MRILYAETTAYAPSSAHFLEALEASVARGQHEFRFLDEAQFIKSSRSFAERIADRVAGRPLSGYQQLNRALVENAAAFSPDMILIGKGRWFTPAALEAARKVSGATLVNWATDDPFNAADNSRELLKSIPLYDLYVCTKKDIMNDVRRAGCVNVAYVRFGYKPEVHFPEAPATDEERERFACDVMFVGGCDAYRIAYFEALVRAMPGVKLRLYGAYWERARALRPYARGFAVARDYRLAVGSAKIAVNLVRRANRDDHVMRTFEIPACGGFMLTERSSTHEELFHEDHEAGFFGSHDELVARVRSYLPRDEDRARIAAAGHRKITLSRHTYGDRLEEIIEAAQTVRGSQKTPAAGGAQTREIESNG
jgi:spore maturation protein CgeB